MKHHWSGSNYCPRNRTSSFTQSPGSAPQLSCLSLLRFLPFNIFFSLVLGIEPWGLLMLGRLSTMSYIPDHFMSPPLSAPHYKNSCPLVSSHSPVKRRILLSISHWFLCPDSIPFAFIIHILIPIPVDCLLFESVSLFTVFYN